MTDRRVAVITGGSSGIGLATGAELVSRGYDVVLTARTEPTLREAAASIGARAVAGNCADPEAFAAVVAEAGHMMPIEAPDALAALILAWLGDLPP